jgi:hypothetical protein
MLTVYFVLQASPTVLYVLQDHTSNFMVRIDGSECGWGETDCDLACTQLNQKLRVYNVIEFKYCNIKTLYCFIIFLIIILSIVK